MAIIDKSELYTDLNRPRVLCLIKELAKVDDTPVFTLQDEYEGYVSLRRLFMRYVPEDPSEGKFAEEVFGDITWWVKAREHPKLKAILDEWRTAADIKRKELAFKAIVDEVKNNGRSAFSAAKFLIDEPWKEKRTAAARKASKETTQEASNLFRDDAERLRQDGFLQ